MNQILKDAKQLLHHEENILSILRCSLIGNIITHNVPRSGVLLATNRRVIFYGQSFKCCKNALIVEFEYKKILSIETKRTFFDKKLIFYYEDEYITVGQILSSNIEGFLNVIQRKRIQ
ncbi:PH domain-containing protein [Bacillus sp. TH44]|uniref:PH domain-containing protein n=2 Tax=unclassified Bacillus (in: firmicutes) TaxID=185979 RepID=UPI00191238C4|nr:PH domain-containing protein [Bacillus sp. TH50]MBK5361130.1 PH domain-containing protein [Bacillus sp. TH44]MBK5365922.1 PH domain-containing protein [Bacillus sp. TH50]